MEQKKSRKEWIKTIAIIFLSVMLVLTFFSQTILNYSLPEVSAQYCYSGEITNKIRGTGTVESADPYSVQAKEGRTVEKLGAKVGDTVEKGDVLYYLEEGDSAELEEALKTLEAAELAYKKALVTGGVTSDVSSGVENGSSLSDAVLNEKLNTIKSLNDKITNLEAQIALYDETTPEKYAGIRKEISDAEAALSSWTTQHTANELALENAKTAKQTADNKYNEAVNYKNAAQAALNAANAEKTEAQEELAAAQAAGDQDAADAAQAKINAADTKITNGTTRLAEAEEALDDATVDYNAVKNTLAQAVTDATTAYNTSKNKVQEYTNTINTKKASLEDTKYSLNKQLTEAKNKLEKVQSELGTVYDLSALYSAVKDAKKNVEDLRSKSSGNTIVAPVSGTILTMNYVSGQSIEASSEVATIQIEGRGYTLAMEVSSDQAKLVTVGDEADIVNSWWYTDVQARVKQIRPSKENPQNGKQIIFELSGDVTPGQSLSVSVGSRSANYDTVIPKSALNEDNNGKFVYKVVSKSAPFGNRYIAERVDVTVLAEDDTQCAVSGAFEGYDYVITTSSKPIEDKAQVRLKD
jgi:multidrug efflux pump subunit AcrA (membrane-fusion protein)